jgi:hypothetical protein
MVVKGCHVVGGQIPIMRTFNLGIVACHEVWEKIELGLEFLDFCCKVSDRGIQQGVYASMASRDYMHAVKC